MEGMLTKEMRLAQLYLSKAGYGCKNVFRDKEGGWEVDHGFCGKLLRGRQRRDGRIYRKIVYIFY